MKTRVPGAAIAIRATVAAAGCGLQETADSSQHAIKQYGEAGDPGTQEVRVELG